MDAIQKIYIALFGRPADPLGLEFFIEQTNGGANLSAIANLSGTEEYQSRFRGLTSTEIITEIYNQLFGRDPDPEGLAIFEAALASGRQSINTIAINIAQSAREDDLIQLNNKVAAANLFTASIDTPAEIAAYKGDAAAAEGRAFLATITEDPATIPTQAEVDAAVADIGNGGTGGGGSGGGGGEEPVQFIDLVAGPTESVGGGGNDVFYGIVAQTGSTLDDGDVIDGRGGNDALVITADDVTDSITPALTSVEVLLVNGENVDLELDLADSDPIRTVQLYESDNFTLTLGGLGGLVDAFIFDTEDASINLQYTAEAIAGTSDTQNVTLSGAVDTVFRADGVETLHVFASGSPTYIENETNSALFEGDNLETIRIFGDGAVEIGDTDVSLFDASEAGGEISVRLNGGAQTAIGGTGDDFFNFISAFNLDDSLDGGAGFDQMRVAGGDFSSEDDVQPFNERVTSVERLSFIGGGTTIDDDTLNDDNFEQIQFRTVGDDLIQNANSVRSYEFGRENTGDATINLSADLDSVNVALFSLPDENGEIDTLAVNAAQPGDPVTLNLDSQGDFSEGVTNRIANLDLAEDSQVNLSGDGDLTIAAFETDTSIFADQFEGNLVVGGSRNLEIYNFGGDVFDASEATGEVYVILDGGAQEAIGGAGYNGFEFGDTFDINDTVEGGGDLFDEIRVVGGDYSSEKAAEPFNKKLTEIERVVFTGDVGTTLDGATFTNEEITRLQFRTLGDDVINNAGSARLYEFGRLNDGDATLNLAEDITTANVRLISNGEENGAIDTLRVRAEQQTAAVELNLISDRAMVNADGNEIATIDLVANSRVILTGDDILDIGGFTARVQVDASAYTGNLTIEGSQASPGSDADINLSGQDSIALGAGNHRVEFSSGLDSGVVDGRANGSRFVDVIAGFTAGNGGDVLDYTGLVGEAGFQVGQSAPIEAVSLQAAADTASGGVIANTWTAFRYEGQSYALYEADGDNSYTGGLDVLVQLAGVDVTTLTADNFA